MTGKCDNKIRKGAGKKPGRQLPGLAQVRNLAGSDSAHTGKCPGNEAHAKKRATKSLIRDEFDDYPDRRDKSETAKASEALAT